MNRRCPDCGTLNRIPVARVAMTAKCGRCKQRLPAHAEPVSLESSADFDALVSQARVPVVVDFWAPWCGPCRTVAPELEKIARARAGHVVIAKLNTDAVPDIAQRFQIRSIPTLIRFDRGQETKRISGAMGAAQITQSFGL